MTAARKLAGMPHLAAEALMKGAAESSIPPAKPGPVGEKGAPTCPAIPPAKEPSPNREAMESYPPPSVERMASARLLPACRTGMWRAKKEAPGWDELIACAVRSPSGAVRSARAGSAAGGRATAAPSVEPSEAAGDAAAAPRAAPRAEDGGRSGTAAAAPRAVAAGVR